MIFNAKRDTVALSALIKHKKEDVMSLTRFSQPGWQAQHELDKMIRYIEQLERTNRDLEAKMNRAKRMGTIFY